MQEVTIRHAGNLLELSNPPMHVLSALLTYKHVKLLKQPIIDPVTRKKRTVEIIDTAIYSMNGEKMLVPHGALDRIRTGLTQAGFSIKYEDIRAAKPLVNDVASLQAFLQRHGITYRKGQDTALAIVMTRDTGQFEAPPGWGKTEIIGMVCALYPTARVLICTPGKALLGGTAKRLEERFPGQVGVCSGTKKTKGRIMVSTFGSVLGATVIGGDPDIILIDECHQAAAPEFSCNLARIRSYRKIFGFSATPEGRSDNAELVTEMLAGPVVFRVGYADMVVAGAVSQIQVAMVDTRGHVEEPSSAKLKNRTSKLRNCVWRNRARNDLIARAVKEVPTYHGIKDDLQVLILVATVEHAFNLAKRLPDYALVYSKKDAEMAGQPDPGPKIAELRDQFERGTLRKVIATGTWGTGVDFVQLDVLVYASGAPSKITTTQWAGRNSRKRQDKPYGLVIDFVDKWDGWMNERTLERVSTYRRHGWKIVPTLLRSVHDPQLALL